MSFLVAASLALLAQSHPLPTFANLQPGGLPVVYVTDRAGHETTGKLLRITDADLTIAINGAERTFSANDVALVERRGDSLKNGAIAGLVVGLGMGVLSGGLADCPGDHPGGSCPAFRIVGVALSGAFYTAIGTGIDAAIQGRTRIWPAKATKAGAPIATISPAGRRLFIGWRVNR